MEITYRRARPSDAAALLEYLKQVGGESDNLTFGAEGVPFSVEQEENFIKKLSESETDIMLLALDGERIVGNGALSTVGRNRFAHRRELSVAVIKDYWGQGVGSGIMERLIEYAKNSGVAVVELQVLSDNERAKALYRKFGFEYFGTFKKFFRIEERYADADYMNLYL